MRTAVRARTDFYPRPHMEGDEKLRAVKKVYWISTHALTWRATRKVFEREQRQMISTHALTWRAT